MNSPAAAPRDLVGVLPVDKPSGPTSRAVVNRLQRLAPGVKLGHAGTLDPLASGVLVVLAGKATRLVDYLHEQAKEYRGVFLLGQSSDTEDVAGQVTLHPAAPVPTRAALEAAARDLVGEIQQVPPAFSALKVDGKRAYDLARRGAAPALAARPVTVYRLEIAGYEYPRLELHVACGGGTYVRSLGRDLARAVGTEAVMASLVRTAVGPFRLTDCARLDELTPESLAQRLLPVSAAVPDLPQLHLTERELLLLDQTGRCPAPREMAAPAAESQASSRYLLLAPDGRAVAIAAPFQAGLLRAECRVG